MMTLERLNGEKLSGVHISMMVASPAEEWFLLQSWALVVWVQKRKGRWFDF